MAAQERDPQSTLFLDRDALRMRRTLAALGDGDLRWRSDPGSDLLVFERPGRYGGPV